MNDFNCAPILLIGFNRPDFMADQIAAVRKVAPRKIYLAVDGPRKDRPSEGEKCRAVQECAKLIDWTCEINTLFQDENLGCKYGPYRAMDWLFAHEEYGIVLEDDCRPTVDFLRFASEMLEKYAEDDRIGAVNGFNHFNLQSDKSASYHFSSHMDVLGWASWRRVWHSYDITLEKYNGVLESIISSSQMTPYTKKMFKAFVDGLARGLDAWDIQFSIMMLAHGWLSVVPRNRLVANVGFADERAAHTSGYIYWSKDWSRAGSLDWPLVHPAEVVCDDVADRLRERMEGAIFPRGLTWLGSKFPLIGGLVAFVGEVAEKIAPFLFRW